MYEYIWMNHLHVQKFNKKEMIESLGSQSLQIPASRHDFCLKQINDLKINEVLNVNQFWIAKRENQYCCIKSNEFEQKEDQELLKLKKRLKHGGFQLDWTIQDKWQLKYLANVKHAKNYTQWIYRNGKRIDKQDVSLQEEDWIYCWPYEFYVLDDSLWINLEHPYKTKNLDLFSYDKRGDYVFARSLVQEQFQIEPYLENRKTNSMRMASPAGMIVISSLASVLSNWITNPSQESMIQAGLVSAMISGGAFVGWYGWQAHRRKVLQQKDENELMKEYLDYLRLQVQTVEQRRRELNNHFIYECEKIKSFDRSMHGCLSHDGWALPAGIQKSIFGSFQYPNIPWQLAMSNSKKALDQLASQPFDCWTFSWIEQGGIYDLTNWRIEQVLWLYLLWCWMAETEQRKFVWITKKKLALVHNGSMFDHQFLCFSDEIDFFALQSQYPQIEWTIASDRPLPETKCSPKDTLLYIQEIQENQTTSLVLNDQDQTQLYDQRALQQTKHCQIESLFAARMPPEYLWRKTSYLALQEGQTHALQMPTCYRHELEYGNQEQEHVNLCVELCPGVYWDLKKEGPHALIAGATGSGKSEGLCSILYQLALQNSAKSLQYVLIDFKGGSFLSPFLDLPHTAAVLTNLDFQAIWRLEKALNQELERRQDAISEFLKRNPGCQTEIEAVRNPKTNEPFSEIIVVVDEFGQLKSRCPEFMQSLQQMARIGRSLGFHLILSTQKPAGIVDDQIWANAKSRLCFPVLDRMDSREVLGHEKAAMLKASGEFILQTDESEKMGRMFYLKRPYDGTSKVELFDKRGNWQVLEQQTLQDAIRYLILKRQEAKQWLLSPDLNKMPDEFSGLQEDLLDHFETYKLPEQQMHLCLASHAQIEQLFCILFLESRLPTLTNIDLIQAIQQANFKIEKDDKVCEQLCHLDELGLYHLGLWQNLNLASLWQITALEKRALVLIKLDEQLPSEWIEALSKNHNLTVLAALDHVSFRQEKLFRFFTNRIIGEVDSRDQLSLFSEGKLAAPEKTPLFRILEPNAQKEQYVRVVMGNRFPKFKTKPNASKFCDHYQPIVMEFDFDQTISYFAKGFIGIETSLGKPLFKGVEPIVLCWQKPNAKKLALRLVERLNFENPQYSFGIYPEQAQFVLCDLSLIEDPASTLKESLEKADVLFIGEGLSQYSYAIHLPYHANTNSQAVYIHQGELIEVQLAQ
ncbi:MAG: FtsK/SpoIIIE domain-containing protein [Erysipelotrichaceae bacterium]|nr:FtsK/SpoIIIE domain-containing protein [Erysipelotrichaceae bacterium]